MWKKSSCCAQHQERADRAVFLPLALKSCKIADGILSCTCINSRSSCSSMLTNGNSGLVDQSGYCLRI